MPIQLSFLREVSAAPGPVATIALDVSRDVEDAQAMIDLRWASAWERLRQAGAPESVRARAEEVVGARRGAPGPAAQFLVVDGERVRLEEILGEAPVREIADWAPLPHVMPLVAMLPPQTRRLVVRVSRADAEITVVAPAGEDREEVRGDDWPLTKVRSGGWSQRRIQARAENLWEKNAAKVAERIDALAGGVAPAFIAVSGDVRAKAALRARLGSASAERLVDLDGPGGDASAQLGQVVAKQAADEDAAVIGRLRQQLGRAEDAVQGLADVVRAARRGQVETLVLENEIDATTRLFAGPDPLDLGLSGDDVIGSGPSGPLCDRADAVLLRALAAGGADLVLARPGGVGLADGVGALLRYRDESTGRG